VVAFVWSALAMQKSPMARSKTSDGPRYAAVAMRPPHIVDRIGRTHDPKHSSEGGPLSQEIATADSSETAAARSGAYVGLRTTARGTEGRWPGQTPRQILNFVFLI
jgi:hypothetical protein